MKKLALGLAAVLMVCVFAGCGGKQQAALDNYFEVVQGFDEFPYDERVVDLVEASLPVLGISDKELDRRDEWAQVARDQGEKKINTYSLPPSWMGESNEAAVLSSDTSDGKADFVLYTVHEQGDLNFDAEAQMVLALRKEYGEPYSARVTLDKERLDGVEVVDAFLQTDSMLYYTDASIDYIWHITFEKQDISIFMLSVIRPDNTKTMRFSISYRVV